MAVREFTDSHGVEWRAWDVTTEHMHPVTRSEDYMANLQDGWLAFESATEKRRLPAPYPSGWITMPIVQIEELCARATSVTRKAATTESGKYRAVQATKVEEEAMNAAHVRRVFSSPMGREWTVRLHECLDPDGAHQTVLRFTCGDVVMEMTRWPDDWQSATVERFGLMLLDAEPPRRRKRGVGPQRRREDHAE